MLDERRAIASGKILKLDKWNQYTITEEIGRGASCIVYGASYRDAAGHDHLVRIKECYPYDLEIIRTPEGALKPSSFCREEFCRDQKRFEEAYAKNVRLKNTLGLTNSTVDAVNLFTCNDTMYAVMTCVEGRDYRGDEDQDLQSLFTRILALSKIVKRYHDNGVLHLDIKPENMFLIPETKEHMVLFDFDSMVEKEKLKNGAAVRVSFSDGYAAPELVRGNQHRISEAADIYSIGAVMFYKLFGRTPNALDGAVGVTYDFTLMKKKDERYQPELFMEMSTFLHKTIASSPAFRYKNMDEVIPVLERLIRMSDIDNVFLFHNFSYHFSSFVSRERELDEIGRIFDSGSQILFLTGIGGIGKTQLAKRYACDNSGKYRKIVFVSFTGSILETVCRDDICINRVEQGEDEEDREYFERKLHILKTVVSKEDLVILDNFDVESDDDLERLFECPCKFLVTSREDFRDYGYEQLSIGRMADMDELLKLFEIYNRKEYQEAEKECIRAIMDIVDGHTMTVELIAKYLRTAEDRPQTVLEKLMMKEGITGTSEIKVKHQKNRKMRAESIDTHLLALFDLTCFSSRQRELIKSLSLLGYVRISAETFLEYCPVENGKSELESLIRRGWIEYDRDREKISLHQIILDLIYNHLNPTSEDCPHIMKKMTEYLAVDIPGYAKLQVRKRLLEGFVKRAEGRDLVYARLCILYCINIKAETQYLDKAEQICLSSTEKEAYDILQEICRLKIRKTKLGDQMWNRIYGEEDFDQEAYLKEASDSICCLAEKAYSYARKFCDDHGWLGKFCVKLAYELDAVVEDAMMSIGLEGHSDSLDQILDMAVALFDDGESYLLDAQIDPKEKISLFQKIQGFFSDYDFSAMYRSENYSDGEKAVHYQKIIDQIRESKDEGFCADRNHIYLSDVKWMDLIMAAEYKGEYEKAIELYRKAYADGNETYEFTYQDSLSGIADNYLRIGDKDNGVKYYEAALQLDREQEGKGSRYFIYSNSICYKLIQVLMGEGRYKEARRYCGEMIYYNKKHAEENSSDHDLSWLSMAFYLLYKTEGACRKQREYWEKSVACFQRISGKAEFSHEFTELLIELADQEKEDEEKIKKAFEYMERTETGYGVGNYGHFINYILSRCEGKTEYVMYHIKALVCYSEYLNNDMPHTQQNGEQALDFCRKARDLYEANHLEDEYWYSRIHKGLGDCCLSLNIYDYAQAAKEKRKCNFWLLAQREAQKAPPEQQADIWRNGGEEYKYIDQFSRARDCYEKALGILAPILDQHGYSSFQNYWYVAVDELRCCERLHDREQIRKHVLELYRKAVDHYINEDKKAGEEKEEKEKQKARHQNVLDFSWKLRECAGYLLRAQWETEAYVLYIMEIMVLAGEGLSRNVLEGVEEYGAKEWGKLLELFSSVLHGNVMEQNADDVVRAYDDLREVFEREGRLAEFDREMKWFLAEYQNREIEFKR